MCIYLYINRGSDCDINLKTAYDTEGRGWPGGSGCVGGSGDGQVSWLLVCLLYVSRTYFL